MLSACLVQEKVCKKVCKNWRHSNCGYWKLKKTEEILRKLRKTEEKWGKLRKTEKNWAKLRKTEKNWRKLKKAMEYYMENWRKLRKTKENWGKTRKNWKNEEKWGKLRKTSFMFVYIDFSVSGFRVDEYTLLIVFLHVLGDTLFKYKQMERSPQVIEFRCGNRVSISNHVQDRISDQRSKLLCGYC